jgi:hypothetical protein
VGPALATASEHYGGDQHGREHDDGETTDHLLLPRVSERFFESR